LVVRGVFDGVVVNVRECAFVVVVVVRVVECRRGVSLLMECAFGLLALVLSIAAVFGFLGFVYPVFPLGVLVFARGVRVLTSAVLPVPVFLFLSLESGLSVSVLFVACLSLVFPSYGLVSGVTAMFGCVYVAVLVFVSVGVGIVWGLSPARCRRARCDWTRGCVCLGYVVVVVVRV
jgi:hypothetical protein